jgi:signal peptidase I
VKRPKSRLGSVGELVVIVAIAVGLALGIQALIVKPYRIPSGSMEPTLAIGQRVLVDRIGTDFSEPHVGEIAVFHPSTGAEEQECGPTPHAVTPGGAACSQPVPHEAGVNFIKRIVAGPGDEIYVKEGHVYRRVDGKGQFVREKDSYIRACGASSECNFVTPIKIPAGHWFMMGDNRGDSDDSRFWGPVPTGWIIGQAIVTYWPPDRIGIF